MNIENKIKKRRIRLLLQLIVILIFLVISIICNYIIRDYKFLLRIFTVAFVSMIFLYLIPVIIPEKITTFVRESYSEMKKVIWPTYQETLYATLIIISVTILASIVLWGLDSILIRLVSFISNLRF